MPEALDTRFRVGLVGIKVSFRDLVPFVNDGRPRIITHRSPPYGFPASSLGRGKVDACDY